MLDSTLVAWSYYLIAAAGLWAFCWYATRGVRWPALKRVLRVVAAILLFCPFSIGDGYNDMAPAILMVLMETVFEGSEAFMRVGPTLVGALAIGIVISLVWDFIVQRYKKRKAQAAELDKHRDDLLSEGQEAS